MGKILFKYYYNLKRIYTIDYIENTKPNDQDYYFISFSELKKIIKLYKKDTEKYEGVDWYQVWQDKIEISSDSKIRIEDITYIGPMALKIVKKRKNYLSVKNS